VSAILDLHDGMLRLWHGDDCLESPGYAWFDGSQFRFGIPALRTQRRTPREVNTRYWSQISTQPLSPPLGKARHTADLVHAHLQALHQQSNAPGSVLLSAPGSMDRDALSLLLGIIEHLPFTVAGLVHRTAALAAGSGLEQGLHVELQLHQTVLTPFSASGGELEAGSEQVLTGQGLLALQDQLASAIAGNFVSQTRFDPLRSADAEQALYDALPELLLNLKQQGEAQLAINGYTVRVTRDDLAGVGAAFGATLQGFIGQDAPVLLEGPLDLLPGLALPTAVHTTQAKGLGTIIGELSTTLLQRPDELALRRRVPTLRDLPAEETVPTQGGVSAASAAPTHLLVDGVARALSANTILAGAHSIDADPEGVRLRSNGASEVLINGEPGRDGQALAPGDQLSLTTGYAAQLIVVEE
jgi:hypothetical protein